MSGDAMTDDEVVEAFDRWSRRFRIAALGAGEHGTVTVTYTAHDALAMARSFQACKRIARVRCARANALIEIEAERRGLEVTRAVWRARAEEGFRRGCFYTIVAGAAGRVLFDVPAVVAWWLS
ncbi:MAG: hypothetical protein CMN87_12175 [Stappia sp.]|uniref:hypothetical protein n=1 Tax=Stappia sp. TaxID=1870903 RepID=UPI000C695DB0|nr:hypothetical protein [Stappia sp.]MAB00119.1 hypothetical protein [Stappia sp.]MBM20758.1 hypothetical protein [Stappia sp.]